jgi:hypothetical protein
MVKPGEIVDAGGLRPNPRNVSKSFEINGLL